LRASRERPCRRRGTSNSCDKIASSHCVPQSGRARTVLTCGARYAVKSAK
jgi:hypothetical protein